MDVYFWQNMPSHIQAPAINELANIWPAEVHCVWETPITPDRTRLGWQTPEMPNVTQHVVDGERPQQFVDELIEQTADAIHIFSGLDSYRWITAAFHRAAESGAKNLALMAEPGIALGWRGWLRPYRARWVARRYRPYVKLVLAMGQTGVQFYRRAGFDQQIVFPYMYQSPAQSNQPMHRQGDEITLVFVGKFVPRKGLDILLRAVAQCPAEGLHLRIIGGGPQESRLRKLCQELSLHAKCVTWCGVQDHEAVLKELRVCWACVVPSRFEGWGVVVNEAISLGTPVICSDTTTARDLVQEGECGLIFRSGDDEDLAAKIDELFTGDRWTIAKNNAFEYRDKIAPPAVAAYLRDVLDYRFGTETLRPKPPWEGTLVDAHDGVEAHHG